MLNIIPSLKPAAENSETKLLKISNNTKKIYIKMELKTLWQKEKLINVYSQKLLVFFLVWKLCKLNYVNYI